jgi:peptide/nickel transport system permease protein
VSGRTRYLLSRVLITLLTLLLMSVFVFALIRLVPGDPVRTMLGFRATPENIATVRHALGLDQPLPQQYVAWLGGVLRGDLGQDFVSRASVTSLIGQRLPVTLELTLLAMGLAVVFGVALGIVSTVGPRWSRIATEGFVVGGVSVPDFWLGTLLILLFAATWQLLPPSGYVPFSEAPVENLRHMILPVLTLAIGEAAYVTRTTRGALAETLNEPFITFLRAKGVPSRTIVARHALRNAALPVVTAVGIQFGVLLGGAIVIEQIFGLPGVGKLIVTAISQRNYTVVQGGVLVIAALFIIVNLVTDLLYGLLDPRVEQGGR